MIFGLPDWPTSCLRALERFQLVQLFDVVHYLRHNSGDRPPDVADTYASRVAMVSAASRGADPMDLLADGDRRAVATNTPGFAWAMPRETIERARFFDTCIIGGGDRAMIAAVYGAEDHVIARQRMTPVVTRNPTGRGPPSSVRSWAVP